MGAASYSACALARHTTMRTFFDSALVNISIGAPVAADAASSLPADLLPSGADGPWGSSLRYDLLSCRLRHPMMSAVRIGASACLALFHRRPADAWRTQPLTRDFTGKNDQTDIDAAIATSKPLNSTDPDPQKAPLARHWHRGGGGGEGDSYLVNPRTVSTRSAMSNGLAAKRTGPPGGKACSPGRS